MGRLLWPLLLVLSGCLSEPAVPTAVGDMTKSDIDALLLRSSPLPPRPMDPTNRWANDPRAVAFGRTLFYDTRLSPSGTINCATCHDPDKSFADGRKLAVGMGLANRHTPTLWNVAWQRWYFWDGRTDSLWAQAIQPIENPVEMGSDRTFVATVVYAHTDLRKRYETLFGPMPPFGLRQRFPDHARPVTDNPNHPHHRAWLAMAPQDRDAVNRVLANVTKAIAAFEREIVSRDSPFDRYVAARKAGDPNGGGHLPGAALRGARLFFGRANCFVCHSGPNFSDGEFHNVVSRLPNDPLDPGRLRGIRLLQQDLFNSLGTYSDDPHAPIARLARHLARTSEQLGQFKTPTLRNIARTAPYMHDGRFTTLAEVVRFHSELPGEPALGHREDFMHPLFLSAQEQAELVAFLESLTDESTLPRLQPTVTDH